MDDVSDRWEGEGFGLALESSYPVLGVTAGRPTPNLPCVSLNLRDSPGAETELPTRGRVLRDIRYPDGSSAMSIERLTDGGFLIRAPRFGAHVVDGDGATASSTPAAGLVPRVWQRLLIGQVLPLLAALRGREVLHAASVVIDGVAFGMLGDSGVGKSTLAASLAQRGAQLLGDDVLAVSLGADGTPLAHRGSPTLALRPDREDLGNELIDGRDTEPLESHGKQLFAVGSEGTPAAAPLGALYLLARARGGPIEDPRAASVIDLMRFSYIRYVQTPARLTGQLELQSVIAGSVPIVPVRISNTEDPAVLAELLELNMRGLASERPGWVR